MPIAKNLKPQDNRLLTLTDIEPIKQVFYAIVVLIGLVTICLLALIFGLRKSVDQQNTMLCYSAKRSGNLDYLSACDRYYKTGDIKYMRDLNAKNN